MLGLLLALDASPATPINPILLGLALLSVVGGLEKWARKRWGIVLGVPIRKLDEDYPGSIGNPRDVDLDPHLYDLGRVEWVTDERLLLLPIKGESNTHTSDGARETSRSAEFMCIGDLRIDASPGSIRFRTRVLLRIVPMLGALLFIVGPYLPWGLDWPLPGGEMGLAGSLGPLILFAGFFGYIAVQARTGVITAHHAVTAAFMATLRPTADQPD